MKLTGNLKKQVESAPTKDEKREAVKQAGLLCSDDELDQVAGGFNPDADEETCPYHRGCYKYNSEFCNKETCIWAK